VNHLDPVGTPKADEMDDDRPCEYFSWTVSDFDIGSGDRLPLLDEARLCLLFWPKRDIVRA